MKNKITCPITLGEYERVVNNEKEHTCNCVGKCKVCKCKVEKENKFITGEIKDVETDVICDIKHESKEVDHGVLYDKLNDSQKEVVYEICKTLSIDFNDCKVDLVGDDRGIFLPNIMLITPEMNVSLPFTLEDLK